MSTESLVQTQAVRRRRDVETAGTQWFDLTLSLHLFSRSAGAWGSGITRQISRNGVEFVASGLALRVGDVLQFVLAFPGPVGQAGAVASCRGRVVRSEDVVVATIDRCRLLTVMAAQTSRNARTRRLAGLCQCVRTAARSNPLTPLAA